LLAGCGAIIPVRESGFPERSDASSQASFVQTGVASWYGPGFHGQQTASGEIYDMYALTAAHKRLPFHSKVRVTNLDNGKAVVVRINDRGPFRKQRIIDLSLTAARELEMVAPGTAKVRVEKVSAGASRKDRFSLQLGSFRQREHAQHSKRKAANVGLSEVRINEIEIRGRRYYRVLAGRFASRAEADSARHKANTHFPESFILVD
jgi:rare lipoprotein A